MANEPLVCGLEQWFINAFDNHKRLIVCITVFQSFFELELSNINLWSNFYIKKIKKISKILSLKND